MAARTRTRTKQMKLGWIILIVTVSIAASISAIYVTYLAPLLQSAEPVRDNAGNVIMDMTPINAFLEVFITGLGAAVASTLALAVIMKRRR